MFDGLAFLEVFFDDLWGVGLYEAEVPGPGRVDDGVGAVFAEAQALDGIYPDVAVHARGAKLVLEGLADVFGAAFFAVAALADEDVGVVVANLRDGLCGRGEGAVPRAILAKLFRFLGDGYLRL